MISTKHIMSSSLVCIALITQSITVGSRRVKVPLCHGGEKETSHINARAHTHTVVDRGEMNWSLLTTADGEEL